MNSLLKKKKKSSVSRYHSVFDKWKAGGIISALPKGPLLLQTLLGNYQVAKKNFKLPKLLSDLVLIYGMEVSMLKVVPLCFSVQKAVPVVFNQTA